MGILANHPFYHFWQTIVFVIFAGGPGLALNGPDLHTVSLMLSVKQESCEYQF